LIATVAESSCGAYPYICGCQLSWEGDSRPDAFLFGESQSRYILSCSPHLLPRLKEIFDFHRVPHFSLGKTGGREIVIRINGNVLVRLSVEEAYGIWYNSIASKLG